MSERQIPIEDLPSAAPDVPLDVALATPEKELFGDPADFTAVGGPESEPAYGRTRALAGEYPFNAQGGPYDRDEPAHVERGGIQTHHHAPEPQDGSGEAYPNPDSPLIDRPHNQSLGR